MTDERLREAQRLAEKYGWTVGEASDVANLIRTATPETFLAQGPCHDGKRHKWCNHPGHLHCVVCNKYREPKYD